MGINFKKCWNDLDQPIAASHRELLMGLTICSLAGVLLGMLLSPRKNITIGSHNGGNVHNQYAELPSQESAAPGDGDAAE